MSQYQGESLDEVLSDGPLMVEKEPRQTGRLLRFGFTLGLVGCAGAALVYSQRPQQTKVVDHVALISKDIISAFSRNLQSDGEATSAKIDVLLVEDGVDEPSWPMKIAVKSRIVETASPSVDAVITFNSKEGEARDLRRDLQAVLDGCVSFGLDQTGEDLAPMFETDHSKKRNEASITVHLPPEVTKDLASAESDDKGTKPDIRASVSFGRTLEDMLANEDESIGVVHGGLKVSARVGVGKNLLELGAKAGARGGEMAQGAEALGVLASFQSRNTIKYRKDHLAQAMPVPLGALVMGAHSIPFKILEPLKKLHQHADGLKSIEIRGLPGKEELVIEFTEFKASAALAKAVASMEPPPFMMN